MSSTHVLTDGGNFDNGGDELAGVTSAVHNLSTALMNLDGTSKLVPGWGCTLESLGGVTASDPPGNQRHTRATHHRRVRRVRLTVPQENGAGVAALRKAVGESRGGAGAVAWRHPEDAAGDVESAPLWRVMSCEARRAEGGAGAGVSVELEEV